MFRARHSRFTPAPAAAAYPPAHRQRQGRPARNNHPGKTGITKNLDFRAKTTGMIIGGGSSVFAWVLIAVLLAGSAVTIAAMITVVRLSKE